MICLNFLKLVVSVFLRFVTVFEISEVYRKVGKVGAVILHQVSSKSEFRVPSYDQNTVLGSPQGLFRVSVGSL